MARASLFQNKKFKRLVARLGIPRPHVVGLLETMWHACYETGDPMFRDMEEIEAAAEWTGKTSLFAESAILAGFVDVINGGSATPSYEVHDFWDHAPRAVNLRRKREDERRNNGLRQKRAHTSAQTRTESTVSSSATPDTRLPTPDTRKKYLRPSDACGEPGVPNSPPSPVAAGPKGDLSLIQTGQRPDVAPVAETGTQEQGVRLPARDTDRVPRATADRAAAAAEPESSNGRKREHAGAPADDQDLKSLRFPQFPCCAGRRVKDRVWSPSDAQISEWTEAFPAVAVTVELRAAHVWVMCHFDQRKTATGMPAFISRWLARAQNQSRGHGANGNGTRGHPTPRFSSTDERAEATAARAIAELRAELEMKS